MVDSLHPKVAMVGMDAAELSFIQQHLHSLPTIRGILETGTLHRLRSTAGVFPGSVWPTFYSGMLPGEHGVYHHLQWDAGAMQLRRVSEDWAYVEPFWYELERRGFRVATLDVPMSFPSRLTRGVEVINWGSHDELGPFQAHPRHLAGEILRQFGRHPMGSEIPVKKTANQLEKNRRNLVAGAKVKGALSRWLLAQADWDFFLTIFGETHRGGHLLWPENGGENSAGKDALLDVYCAVDRSIAELLQAFPETITTFVLFAVHGMGANDSQEHFMPRVMDRVNASFFGNHPVSDGNRGGESHGGQRSTMRALREHLPAGIQNAIARGVPVAVRDMVVSRQISAGHDWSHTPGIPVLADLNGYLRWNLEGRERRGMLRPDGGMLDRYVAWVRQCLRGLRVSGIESELVREVLLSSEQFPGKRTGMLPDAVVTWTGVPPAARIYSEVLGHLVGEPGTGRAGNHRSDGFCVIVNCGKGQARNVRPPQHISELSTVVVELLGQPRVEA